MRVFSDPTHRRKGRVRRLTLAVFLVSVTWTILFLGGAVSLSRVADEIALWWNIRTLDETAQSHHGHGHDDEMRSSFIAAARAAPGQGPACEAVRGSARDDRGPLFGHVPTALDWAPLSLNQSCEVLDVVTPDWLTLKAGETGVAVEVAGHSVREAVETYRANADRAPALMPTVLLDVEGDAAAFLARLVAPGAGEVLAGELATATAGLDAVGACLDFRQLDAVQLRALGLTFAQVTQGLSAAGLQSCIVLSPEQEIWEDRALMARFDRVVLRAFRQPWVGSPPGPLAEAAWLEGLGGRALAAVGADRLTLAIGNFAVDWRPRQPLPEVQPYAEAVKRAADAGAELSFSPESSNTFTTYRDRETGIHKVWMLDAVTAHNQIAALRALGVESFGLWSLGREDPAIWRVLADDGADMAALTADLSDLRFPNYVAYRGEGAFLRVVSRAEPGWREVNADPETGRITDMRYVQMPQPYVLERYGRPEPGKLVLTFDDGPHAEYTRDILDALKETDTKAAFFVVGARVMEEPGLLERMIAEGHEVGSHTFSHPRMDQVSYARTDLEHGMMSKLIAGYTGHSTRLYREPFLRAGGPIEAARVRSLATVQANGGIIAGMEIVPKDWEGMSADEITAYVVDEVNKGTGNVILLHDGGKDRSATVAAVPRIVQVLSAQGYEFTTLADLLGMERAALMPEAQGQWMLFDRISFGFISVAWGSIETIFWVVLVIGVIRMLMILTLAHIRRRQRPIEAGAEPKVTVVIPAHNEEKVVSHCINSVLASHYGNFDVVVIDDGSQDETFNELLRYRNNPKVHIFAQLNQGKWSALNAAVAHSDAEIMVCIDADTEIDPAAIGHLARQFQNPKVGAVAGKITVGNRRNLLTRLQALEYVTAQNFDRRAYDLINGMLVVPGAIGAWRTEAVRAAGRFCNDTMTEDADLTIAVNRAGYRVTYEEKAVAYTEAPETVRQLLGQRLRWSLGMFQCAWKHKSAIREGRSVGLVSIPDMVIFGYLFPLLAPIADIFVMVLLYNWLSGSWSGEVGSAVADTPTHLIWAYMILPLLDLAVGAYALKTDERESLKLLWLFPFQRFFYRQLLYFSVYRSILRALSGSLAGWGRMRRTGHQYVERTA
ncbi:glycosyltransferase [Marimonas lutisalis]|uniref:glycosyltransferase n=1 Tax=Marimonas lutisalis TaxID=2545756 RepID=UPI001F29C89D|nr:glycosyltransferase [Marimonas lutisalis]